jgi:signal transduction histidine kinase
MNNIFDPFTRLLSPKDFPGTGIGLSITRKIVEQHYGKILATSEIEKEATFFFVLGKPLGLKLR